MQCQCSTKKKTTNATIRPKKKTRKLPTQAIPRTYIPINCAPTSPPSPIYLSRPHPASQTHYIYSFLPPRARPPPSPEPTLPTPAHPCAQRRRRTFVTTSIAKRLAAACCRASFVAAHLYFSWRLRRFVSVTLIGVQLDCAVDHKHRAIVKMVGAHDSHPVLPWHLRFERRATARAWA